MKMCQPHWDMLRQEIIDQGLGEWITQSGEVAAEQLADQIKRGEHTPVNYDPLMGCFVMITTRSIELAGPMVMMPDFGCPICRFNDRRTPDGACACDRPDCEAKAPGTIPDFETWLTGPASCVIAAKEHMRQQGWLTEAGGSDG